MTALSSIISAGGGGGSTAGAAGLPCIRFHVSNGQWAPPVAGQAMVHLIGGGGHGQDSGSNNTYGGGGGGYCRKLVTLDPSVEWMAYVAGPSGQSQFKSHADNGATLTMTASGGTAGSGSGIGYGGGASGGDVNRTGGSGSYGGGGGCNVLGLGATGDNWVAGDSGGDGELTFDDLGLIQGGGRGGRKHISELHQYQYWANYGHNAMAGGETAYGEHGGLFAGGGSALFYYHSMGMGAAYAGNGGLGGGGGGSQGSSAQGQGHRRGYGGPGAIYIQYISLA